MAICDHKMAVRDHKLAECDHKLAVCDHRCNSRAGSTGVGEPEEEEPDWDLPPDLQEYSGNPGDRKAQLAFKQAQTVSAASALLPG